MALDLHRLVAVPFDKVHLVWTEIAAVLCRLVRLSLDQALRQEAPKRLSLTEDSLVGEKLANGGGRWAVTQGGVVVVESRG